MVGGGKVVAPRSKHGSRSRLVILLLVLGLLSLGGVGLMYYRTQQRAASDEYSPGFHEEQLKEGVGGGDTQPRRKLHQHDQNKASGRRIEDNPVDIETNAHTKPATKKLRVSYHVPEVTSAESSSESATPQPKSKKKTLQSTPTPATADAGSSAAAETQKDVSPDEPIDFSTEVFKEEASNKDWAIAEFVKRRAYNGTLMLIPVNTGYMNFGLNLMCSLLNMAPRPGLIGGTAARKGFSFVAMDEGAYQQLREMGLPVFKDPQIPFVSSKSTQWADPNFHKLVCTKLIPVIRVLELGINVVLSDADIVYLKDPVPFFRHDLSLTYSIGSCHRELKDNTPVDGLAKLNTGFYFAQATRGVVHLYRRALRTCRTSSLVGDQPAINSILQDDRSKQQHHVPKAKVNPIASVDVSETVDENFPEFDVKKDLKKDPVGDAVNQDEKMGKKIKQYNYGFFDGCLFANGCVYFKHLCQNATYPPALTKAGAQPTFPRNDPVMVHANFLVGKKAKIKHLVKYNLWDEKCIALYRKDVTEPPTDPPKEKEKELEKPKKAGKGDQKSKKKKAVKPTDAAGEE